jgi:hypothetical protein
MLNHGEIPTRTLRMPEGSIPTEWDKSQKRSKDSREPRAYKEALTTIKIAVIIVSKTAFFEP